MTYDINGLAFLPIRSNDDFSRRLVGHFGIGDADKLVLNRKYSNGEYCPNVTNILDSNKEPRLEGRIACITYSYTQSGISNTEAFARILLLSDAAYRNGAEDVILVMAEHLFDRQDLDPSLRYKSEFRNLPENIQRKAIAMDGQPYSLETLVSHFKHAGISRVLTLDRHSVDCDRIYERIYGRDSREVLFNLESVPVFAHYIRGLPIDLGERGKKLVLVAPDENAWATVEVFRDLNGLNDSSVVYCKKSREVPNDPGRITTQVDHTTPNYSGVGDKIVIVMDDKADTFGTLRNTLDQSLIIDGKPKQLHALVTHMLLTTPVAYENIHTYRINLHGSNSHPNMAFKKDEPGVENITVIDFTPYFVWALINHVVPRIPLDKDQVQDLGKIGELYSVIKKGKSVNFVS